MRVLFIILVVLVASSPLAAADIFFAQAAQGGNTGANCANAIALSSVTWVSPNTYHLCGTITGAFTINASGASGLAQITLVFEAGGSIQMPAIPSTGAIIVTGRQFIVIDGGGGSCGYVSGADVTCTQGQIESTANGSGLANQVASVAIEAGSAQNVTVKGLRCGPLYLHTSSTDTTQSPPGPICVHFSGGTVSNITIQNNTIDDCAWCLNGNSAVATIQNNEIYNSDHGVALGGGNASIVINANHFHDWVNWDQSNHAFHHDGIHLFDQTGVTFNGATESNNFFNGDQGVDVTAMIYNEHAANTGVIQNITMYNNQGIAFTGRFSNVGWFAFWKTATGTGTTGAAYNNGVYGFYSAGNGSCFGVSGWTSMTIENNSFAACQNQIGIDAASTITAVDYNSYDDIGTDSGLGGGANTFTWHGSIFASFTTWKTDCSCDSHGIFNSLANLKLNGSNGRQLSGSPVIGVGLNLTSLSITPLDSDILGNARPGGATPWDMGAYFGVQGASTFVTPVSAIYP